jgi:hypothetical protein
MEPSHVLTAMGVPVELARGSARSVPGVDLTAALRQCAHLLAGFLGVIIDETGKKEGRRPELFVGLHQCLSGFSCSDAQEPAHEGWRSEDPDVGIPPEKHQDGDEG